MSANKPPNVVSVDEGGFPHWRRNLAVCTIGSFTVIVAMTLMLPFLPLYIAQLGVSDTAAIVEWSGVAYGATFLVAAITTPIWGRLSDRYGRKLMLVRASLGMAIVMSLMGEAHSVWELVALRLLTGLMGGYASGSMALVATQTPKSRCGWALGLLSSGIMAGNIAGPLMGGTLPSLIGIRATFHVAGAAIFLTFVATVMLVKRDMPAAADCSDKGAIWGAIPDKRPVVAMVVTGMLLMLANMSIEPIITVYVQQLVAHTQVALVSGLVMSGAALGSILSASRLGKLADRIGHWNVIVASLAVCSVLLIPQAFVTAGWQLIALRFAMGLALGGLLPCIASVIRHSVPSRIAGTMLGYSTSAQFVGQVVGPLAGGFFGGHFGMRSVFLGTAVLMTIGALYSRAIQAQVQSAKLATVTQ